MTIKVLPPVCSHNNFYAHTTVNRVTNDAGDVTDFIADLHIKCDDCGIPFYFLGIPHGSSGNRPATDITATEARLPIVPVDGALRMKSKMPGFSVQLVQ